MTSTAPPSPSPSRSATFKWIKAGAAVALAIWGAWGTWVTIRSEPRRELVYYANPHETVVVKSGQSSRLTTLYDGQPLPADIDVTAAQVQVWSAGNQTIRPENVVQPVYLEVEARMLEATIRSTTSDYDGVFLTTDQLDRGRVGVSWRVLDPLDGVQIQVVYAAKPGAHIKVSGAIEGKRPIRPNNAGEIQFQPAHPPPGRVEMLLLTLLLGGMAAFAIFGMFAGAKNEKRPLSIGSKLALGVLIAMSACLFVGCAYLASWVIRLDSPPPFGF